VVDGNAFADLPKLVGEYRRRRPQETVLYQVVQENYRTYASFCEDQNRPLPGFVCREFEKYLRCGVLCEGFARLHCSACGYDRLVGFSCKRRGFCPSCLGRRMNDGAAYLVDHVFGDTPVRHWVLSLPHPLRYILAYDASLLSDVLGGFIEEVFRFLRWQAKSTLGLDSVTQAHPGAVTAIQRSSSHLSLNIHFHSLVSEGVFVQEDSGGPAIFHQLPPPTDDEVSHVASEVCKRTIALLKRKGRWHDDPEQDSEDPLAAKEPALADAYQASIRGVLSMGPGRGQRVVRFFGAAAQRDGEGDDSPRRPGGFDLYARQATFSHDRERVEKLARYILRPPLAQNHLQRLGDGRVVLQLKRAWRDGTTAVIFDAVDLMSKLVALIPRPRVNTLRFHGVDAAHARLRDQVVPEPDELPADRCGSEGHQDPAHRSYRLAWADLLKRVFSVDVLICPHCESRLSRIAWILDPVVIRRILEAVGLPGDSPPLAPARSTEELFLHAVD